MPLRVKQALVLLAGVVAAVVMTWLGLWQLQVFTDQGNASAQARAQQAPVPLLDFVAADGTVGDIYGKPVTVSGRYLPGEQERVLGSDGVAPDRSYDMFRHVFQAMRYQRARLRDATVLPAGKALEMVTIDAARALGLCDEIGSLEVGKKADLILIDWARPHLAPRQMPLYRVAYFANGNDVRTTIVDGKVLMRDRRVLTVDEGRVLEEADREIALALQRTGLDSLTRTPAGFWGRSRLR